MNVIYLVDTLAMRHRLDRAPFPGYRGITTVNSWSKNKTVMAGSLT